MALGERRSRSIRTVAKAPALKTNSPPCKQSMGRLETLPKNTRLPLRLPTMPSLANLPNLSIVGKALCYGCDGNPLSHAGLPVTSGKLRQAPDGRVVMVGMNQVWQRWCLYLVFGLTMSACESETAYIEACGLNYTSSHIRFFIEGGTGDDISPNGGGGSFVCCMGVPRRWRKGLQVTVRWRDGGQLPDVWKEKIVDVPRYEQSDIGFFAVHFYPDDTVKVLVTTKSDEYPGYPYPRPPKD